MRANLMSPCGHPFSARVDLLEPKSCRDCLAVVANRGPCHLEGRAYPDDFETAPPDVVALALRQSGINARYESANYSFVIPLREARMLSFLLLRQTEPRIVDVPGARQGIVIPKAMSEEIEKVK